MDDGMAVEGVSGRAGLEVLPRGEEDKPMDRVDCTEGEPGKDEPYNEYSGKISLAETRLRQEICLAKRCPIGGVEDTNRTFWKIRFL